MGTKEEETAIATKSKDVDVNVNVGQDKSENSEVLAEELLEILADHHRRQSSGSLKADDHDDHDDDAMTKTKQKQKVAADADHQINICTDDGDVEEQAPAPTVLARGVRPTYSSPGAFPSDPLNVPETGGAATTVAVHATEDTTGSPTSSNHPHVQEQQTHVLLEATAVDDMVEAQAKPIEWWTPRKTRRVVYGTVAALILVVLIIIISVGVLVWNSNNNNASTGGEEQTAAPTLTPSERLAAIQEILWSQAYKYDATATAAATANTTGFWNTSNDTSSSSATAIHVLQDPTTPQYQALQWMAYNDEQDRVPLSNIPRVIQRYALAVLYLSTGGPEGKWSESFEFMQPDHECTWSGALVCARGELDETNNVVTGIALPSNGLEGILPVTELGFLTNLQFLSLRGNQLSGELPPIFGSDLLQLTHLDLSHNAFRGSIPTEWTQMTQLRHLHAAFNRLGGTIPHDFGALNQLTSLDLEGNRLTGSIPNSMWDLVHMEKFVIEAQNSLSGTISPLVGQWTNVSVFTVNDNNITGSLPTQLGQLTHMVKFKSAQSHMRGPIPSELGLWTNLEVLGLSRSGYQGTVPTELSQLSNLQELYLQVTWLTGDMDHFCNAFDAGKLPRLTALIADLLEVECSCCTCCVY